MTAEDRVRLAALCAAATPEPWRHETQESDSFDGAYSSGHVTAAAHDYAGNTVSRRDSVTAPDSMTFADGEFIAAARTALPALLAEVTAAREYTTTHAGCIEEIRRVQLAMAERENELHDRKDATIAELRAHAAALEGALRERHHPYAHDYERDERLCATCRLLRPAVPAGETP